MAGRTVRSDGPTAHEWARHMGTIRRLYLDEDLTLKEVMRIMDSEYGFVASAKMYKKRLRDNNYRKNIRSTQSDAQACEDIFSSEQRPDSVTLSNGQVVATDDLATHMQRKRNRHRIPAALSIPNRYHVMEAAYLYTRLYLLAGGLQPGQSEAATVDSPMTDPYSDAWHEFVQKLSAALDMSESIQMGEAIVVMRQAPQAFSAILEHKTSNIIGSLFVFLVVSTPRRPGISDQEFEVYLRVVKSLLNFAATVTPTGSPLHLLLQSLARWDSEDLQNFACHNSASCHTIGQFFPPGSPEHAILTKEVKAQQSSSQPASHSKQWGPRRLRMYHEWLEEQTLFISPS